MSQQITTPLISALRDFNYDEVRRLVASGENLQLDEVTACGTALSNLCMCSNNVSDMINLLLDAGADVNVKDYYGHTPLAIACQTGNFGTIKLLIDKGADVNFANNNKNTPLFWLLAKISNLDSISSSNSEIHKEIINLLLSKGAIYPVIENNAELDSMFRTTYQKYVTVN